jgi:hypothetical protein
MENQELIELVGIETIEQISDRIWKELKQHVWGESSSCDCLTLAALNTLTNLGFDIVKK